MFNQLNKGLKSKQLLALMSDPIKCLQTRNSSRTPFSSKTHPLKSESTDDNHKEVVKNIDYFGIFETNNKEVSGLYTKSDNQNTVFEKYGELLEARDSKMNDQTYMKTNFGRVRLDSQNEPKFHGQYDQNSDKLKFNIDEFEEKLKNSRQIDEQNQESNQNQATNGDNIFEEQYFDELRDSERKGIDVSSNTSHSSDPEGSDLGFIDRNFFLNIEPLFKSKINFKFTQNFKQNHESPELPPIRRFNRRPITRDDNKDEKFKIEDNIEDNYRQKSVEFQSPLKSELFSQNFNKNIESKEKPSKGLEEIIEQKVEEQKEIQLESVEPTAKRYQKIPRTGAQYLADLHSGKESPKYPNLFTKDIKEFESAFDLKGEKLDSKGYRILSGQVFDYRKMTHEDILRLLVDSVLFNDNDIVAINKPYGMSIHSKESKGIPVLTDYLPQLSQSFDSEKLYTVHRLDRDTTGALLLAKTQEMAKELNRMFAEHSITKRYLCITRGIPDDREGIIDIPIELGKTENKERMVLRPEALEEYKSITKPSKTAKRAVTQYQVISESKNAALIEVWPQTGVKHQIRVHLGFGLRCPILGDHKYSHLDKIAPQKLTSDMLLALNVRQAKVRHIPLHLHALQYCLPSVGREGRNIFINAPLPHHFHKNISQLRLRR